MKNIFVDGSTFEMDSLFISLTFTVWLERRNVLKINQLFTCVMEVQPFDFVAFSFVLNMLCLLVGDLLKS